MKKFNLLILGLIRTSNVNVLADLASDKAALLDFYNTAEGENWHNNTNWGSAVSVCQWYKVTCNDKNTGVIKLTLFDNNLDGSIPGEIRKLVSLKYLYFDNSSLIGLIPRFITSLKSIVKIYLYNNCSLNTTEQAITDFIDSKHYNGYQYILDTNGNCMNLSPIYYLLLN